MPGAKGFTGGMQGPGGGHGVGWAPEGWHPGYPGLGAGWWGPHEGKAGFPWWGPGGQGRGPGGGQAGLTCGGQAGLGGYGLDPGCPGLGFHMFGCCPQP